jgi:type IV pilus assembly protein PilM
MEPIIGKNKSEKTAKVSSFRLSGKTKQKAPMRVGGHVFFKKPDNVFVETYDSFSDKLRAKESISIEIDPSGFRVLYMRRFGQKYQVERWMEKSFDGTNTGVMEKAITLIPQFLDRKTIRRSEIVLCLFGPEVLVKTVVVPELSNEELQEAIYWTCKNEASIYTNTDIWDYKIIGHTILNKKPALKILTVFAKEEFVRKHLDLLSKINIHPDRVWAKPIALCSALQKLTHKHVFESKNLLIVDLGKDKTVHCFYSQGRLSYVRTLAMGSDKIDQALLQPLIIGDRKTSLRKEMIDKFKRKYGIISDYLNASGSPSFPFNKLYQNILPNLQSMISEIQRSITFYLNRNGTTKIDAVFLTGRGCGLKNLNLYLTKELGLPVFMMAPSFPKIRYGNYMLDTDYTAAFGAACTKSSSLNLIPKDIMKSRIYKMRRRITIFLSFFLLALLVYYSFQLQTEVDIERQKLDVLVAKYQTFVDTEMEYNQLFKNVKDLNMQKTNIKNILRQDNSLTVNLKIISSSIPDDIVLNFLDYMQVGSGEEYGIKNQREGILLIKGRVIKNLVSADLTLIQFMTDLNNIDYYKEVLLVKKINDIKNKTFLFELELQQK